MPDDASSPADRARTADSSEINALLHDADEKTLLALLENPQMQETHAAVLLQRMDLSAEVIAAVAKKSEWLANESVRLGLAKHPKTQRRTALALLKQLFLFDLVRLSLLPSTPAEIKRVAEEAIVSRVPQVPIGEKLTLARRGPSRVAGAILAEGHPQAMKLALGNSFLTESQVLKVIASTTTPERAIAAIAQHPKWSVQYTVRVALLRNPRTPVPVLLAWLPNITMRDLQDVAGIETLPADVKSYIQSELKRRKGTAAND